MRIKTLSTTLALLSFGLASCGSQPSLGSINMACAGVESYQSKKALALVDAAQGGSAVDSIEVMIGGQKSLVASDSYALSIFDDYLEAMNEWAVAVDQYQVLRQSENLANAVVALEGEIDLLVPKCASKGWNFETGWRA